MHIDNVFTPPKPLRNMVFAAWTKTIDCLFITEDEFKDINIYDSGDRARTGNYSNDAGFGGKQIILNPDGLIFIQKD